MLQSLGVEVVALPFELHPEIPIGGRPGREPTRYSRIADLCDEVGLPFRPPEWIPNTRGALGMAEWVRQHQPDLFEVVDRSLFAAYFAEGRDIGDDSVVDAVLTACSADAAAARAAVNGGEMEPSLDASRDAALELGIAATPTWVIAGMVIPGVQDADFYEHVVKRARARLAES